jgi:hypothetical protein
MRRRKSSSRTDVVEVDMPGAGSPRAGFPILDDSFL